MYFGGVAADLRSTVWPYLLNHYPAESSEAERRAIDAAMRETYQRIMSEWQEAGIVAQQVSRLQFPARIQSECTLNFTL